MSPVSPATFAQAAAVLGADGVVVVPTDTVYGIAALARSRAGTAAIFELKDRPETVALPVLVADVAQARELAAFDERLELLADAFWPGPLTVVAHRAPRLELRLGGDESTIGLRCPAAALVRALARELGPLAVTSANRHGDEPCRSASEVRATFGDELLILDGGELDSQVSSVVSLLGDDPELIRRGAIDPEQVLAVLAP